MSSRAKFVKEITVEDPETGSPIELEVYKHENGGMFAIDSSYLDQVAEEEEGFGETPECVIMDPFSYGEPEALYLEEE
jgi:hypothetical protein